MSKYILDASALLALVKNEPGADTVEKLLGSIAMSAVNISEVAGILLDSEMTDQECKKLIMPFINLVIPFDGELLFATASLKKATQHKGLSLGDRACIATGIKLNVPIYTADKVWGDLNIDKADIRLIR